MGNNKKVTVKVKTEAKKGRVKPKLSSNNGGILTAKVYASINKNKK